MATVTVPRRPRIIIPAEQRFVLSCVSYPQYVAIADAIGERRVRVTYDRGGLELMVTSSTHEREKKLLARLVEALTEELDIDIASLGSMTCRREDLERGFEPDECYYVANEPLVRGRMDLDFSKDPPPDLGLEVEISRSVLNRLGIFAAFKVPEVWRYDGRTIRILLLDEQGEYVESEHSLAFPFLPVKELERFLALASTMSETKLLRSFREWVRKEAAQGWKREEPKKTSPPRRKKGGTTGKRM